MTSTIHPLLMFEGRAAAAMKFYVELFSGTVDADVRYGAGEPGPEGTVKFSTFTLRGETVNCMDSPIKHAFGFTPSVSLAVDCESEDDIARLYGALSEDGTVLMALDNYGFSRRFGWVTDRFGVSWHLIWH